MEIPDDGQPFEGLDNYQKILVNGDFGKEGLVELVDGIVKRVIPDDTKIRIQQTY